MPTYSSRGPSRSVLTPNNNSAYSPSSHGSWDAADWRSKFLDAERRLEKQVAENSQLRERLQETERKLYHCELDAKLSQDTAKVAHSSQRHRPYP